MLFNVVMDKLIDRIKTRGAYKIGTTDMNVTCYTDGVVLIVDTEDTFIDYFIKLR